MLPDTNLEVIFDRIGDRLQVIRSSRRDKIVTVAKSIGVNHSVISQVENGRYKSLNFVLLNKLATYYKITVDDLVLPNDDIIHAKNNPQSVLIELLLSENRYLKEKIANISK